tara:strand:+ start:557 stop:1375 length:819 start_codon:yes stop_codon:yes gene_type:complete
METVTNPTDEYQDKLYNYETIVVLGAGGSRGLAHLGVLEEFEKAKIPIDYIVGCSAGSIVGSLYALYPSTKKIKPLLLTLKAKDILDFDMKNIRFGLSPGNKLRKFLTKYLGKKKFSQLKIPLAVVATDLTKGEAKYFTTGAIVPAVSASSAYPLVFQPVNFNNRLYVDGGVSSPVPTDFARSLKGKVIIAIDVSSSLPKEMPQHLFGVAKRSLEISYLNQSRNSLKSADIIIQPILNNVGTFEENYNQFLYEQGKKEARKQISKIQKLLLK